MSHSEEFPLKFQFCYGSYMVARFHEHIVLEFWNLVTKNLRQFAVRATLDY